MKSFWCRSLAVGCAALLFIASATTRQITAAADAKTVPTFTKDVVPILQRACQECHRVGQIAPMPLLTYEEARPWAKAIKERVSSRAMPPWSVDRSVGIREYLDDPSLTDAEIATIVQWVDGGAPKGNIADMPPARRFAEADEWAIGKPDLIVAAPEWTIPATGPDRWPFLFAPSGLTEDRYVKAIQIKPGNPKVVHHSIAYLIQDHSDAPANEAEQEILDDGRPAGVEIAEYAVGNNGDIYPGNSGYLLKAGADLRIEMHYHTIGEVAHDRTVIGLVLYPKGYVPEYRIRDRGLTAHNLDLEPRQANVRNEADLRLQQPAKLISFQPHMHMRGKAMSLEAVYPDGRREMLTSVPNYNFDWQTTYTYKNPPMFPTGTVIHMVSVHDNSSANRHNPDPENWVGWGRRTIDEMSIAHVNWIFLTEEQYQQELAKQKSQQ